MKNYFLLYILVYSLLITQTTISQTSNNPLDYFKTNLNDLKDDVNKLLFSSPIPDSLILTGESIGNRFGCSVSSAGDVNGDGFDDVIIGALMGNYVGRVYIYYGVPLMDNVADVKMSGNAVYDFFGQSVSTAGDVNDDGYSDVIVGVPINGKVGKAYIYFGGITMDTTVDIYLNGETEYDNFG